MAKTALGGKITARQGISDERLLRPDPDLFKRSDVKQRQNEVLMQLLLC